MNIKAYLKNCLDNEKGFAFIMALLCMLLLTSLGLLVFSLTMKDQITSVKLAAEAKAFSAAEHGVTQVLLNFVPGTSNAASVTDPTTWPQANAAIDPSTRFYYSIPSKGTSAVQSCPYPAGSSENQITAYCYSVDVRGANINFTSQRQLLVGVRQAEPGGNNSAEYN